jgi:hypothetical protein
MGDGTVPRSCPKAGFGISGLQPSGSATTESVVKYVGYVRSDYRMIMDYDEGKGRSLFKAVPYQAFSLI